jgi:hypothetical protein
MFIGYVQQAKLIARQVQASVSEHARPQVAFGRRFASSFMAVLLMSHALGVVPA